MVTLLAVACFALSLTTSEAGEPVQIGIILDGPWIRNDEVLELTQNEITELLGSEFEVSFPAEAFIVGDFSEARLDQALDSLLSADAVGVVITLGPIISHIASTYGPLPKPVIAPFIIDAAIQGVPQESGVSGVKNLTYLAAPWNTKRDIELFYEIHPFHKIAILSSRSTVSAIPGLRGRALEAVAELGADVQVVPVEKDVVASLAHLDPDVDAVYLTSLMHLNEGELNQLMQELINRGLPSFSLFGRYHVELGALASTLDNTYMDRVARRVALTVQRILLGESPETIPVAFNKEDRLVINARTMRILGVSPGWGLLTEAELINEQRDVDVRNLTLGGVMRDARQVSRDLLALSETVAAGKENIGVAWSVLFPQLSVGATGLWIDADRAEATMGLTTERSLTADAFATQVLFSEPAWANVSIQKSLQRSLESEYRGLQLDVSQAAANAYLNTLRAGTFEEIQRQNLKVTRSNLDLARIREAVGSARAAEVLRWEAQIAANRTAVIDANAARNVSEIQLNRILDRPLEEKIALEPVAVNDSILLTAGDTFFRYMTNPGDFKKLRAFLAAEALANAPELDRLEAAISAQERLARSQTRRFYAPEIGLFGDVSRTLETGGKGSDITLPIPDKTDWSLGLQVSLPLLEGGGRLSERRQAYRELSSLEQQRVSAEQRIEQRIRTALHFAGASYAAIGLAKDAAGASDQTLELVRDSYSRGAASILDLIDAQNAALVSHLSVANSEFDFLIDLMEVERSLGNFTVFTTDDQWQSFFLRLDQYFANGQN
jgi:outer membrane protein TolC